jgi:hypothetical protein
MEKEFTPTAEPDTTPVKPVLVVVSPCPRCGLPFKSDTIVASIGYPYHMVLHLACVPFYDFSTKWPHPNPYSYYRDKKEF